MSSIFDTAWAQMERDIAALMGTVAEIGVWFDRAAAEVLCAQMIADQIEVGVRMHALIPPVVTAEWFTPKKNNKVRGYLKDVPILRTKSEPFNPNSSQQIATLLTSLGWQPHVMTEAGKPSTKAAVLMTLPYPEARVISDSKIIAKRLTMLSAGPKSWMNMADDDGRLHTEYNCLGAVTGRANDSPNIAQVPSVKTVTDADGIEHKVLGLEGGYGAECRALFGPPPGWIMVGADMAGLELRCLAHYLFPFDSGDYATIVCTGDVHTVNQQASGVSSRAIAKRLIYCVFYGGGDYKVGTVAEPDEEDEYVVTGIGHQVKQDLISNIAGFRQLFAWVELVQRRHPARAGRSGIVCKEETYKVEYAAASGWRHLVQALDLADRGRTGAPRTGA